MTKKSLARQQRDAAAKKAAAGQTGATNATAWTDLQGLHQSVKEMHDGVRAQVNNFFNIPDVNVFIPDDNKSRAAQALLTFKQDLDIFDQDLAMIYKGHSDRTGGLKDDDNIMKIIELSEAYNNLSVRFDAIISPTYQYLLSVMEMIEKKAREVYEAEKAASMQAAAIDPSVVTDVEVKTPSTTEVTSVEQTTETPAETTAVSTESAQ